MKTSKTTAAAAERLPLTIIPGFKHSLEAMESAFELVREPSDWKAPVCAVVHGEAVSVVVEAIKFYTATVPTVTMRTLPGCIKYLIESPGYRNGPAGDH